MIAPQPDSAGVAVPPPLMWLAALLLGLALDWLRPVGLWPAALAATWHYVAGAAVFVLAGCFSVPAIGRFRSAGTNIEPWRPSTVLVTNGIYRITRNPMYVGLSLLLVTGAAAANTIWLLAMLVPFVALIRYAVIAREEAYLTAKFGEPYRRYLAATRRWL